MRGGISTKNDLQEYIQKNKLEFPLYNSEKTQDDNMWICKLFVNSKIYTSDKFPNKSSAEKHAAEIALLDIEMSKKYVELNMKNTFIFIDLENRQTDIFDFFDTVKSQGITIVGFISHEHVLLSKFQSITDNRFKLVEIPSTRKDATDIGLSLILGHYLTVSECEICIIISGDHFAKVLEECINCQNIYFKSTKTFAKSFSNIKSAVEYLSVNKI
jgi:hypothetical protein